VKTAKEINGVPASAATISITSVGFRGSLVQTAVGLAWIMTSAVDGLGFVSGGSMSAGKKCTETFSLSFLSIATFALNSVTETSAGLSTITGRAKKR
jgi:hypothetical protein